LLFKKKILKVQTFFCHELVTFPYHLLYLIIPILGLCRAAGKE